MTRGDASTKTLIVVAVVGVGLLCGLGGVLGAGIYFYGSTKSAQVEQEKAAAAAERAAQKRAWLASLPADERVAIQVFDDAEAAAIALVRDIVAGTQQGPDAATALALRSLAGGGEPVSLSSPRAETTEEDDGRITAVDVDVVVAWARSAPTTVRISLDRAPDGTLTASAIEIVDAVDSD